jgi:ABC-2 type transport system permease protein
MEAAAMISIPLLKQTTKSNRVLFLIFTIVPSIFLSLTLMIYTTQTADAMKAILSSNALPPAMMQLMGSQLNNLTLNGMLATQFFQMLAILFPMIYVIIVGNKLIADRIDRGDMAYILSTPTKRNKVTLTQALYLFGSLVVMFAVFAIAGLIAAAIFQPGDLVVKSFLLLDLGAFLLAFAISGITFAASCIFNLSKNSLAVGAGLPLTFFVSNLLAKLGTNLQGFKYITLQTLYDTDKILSGSGYVGQLAILAVIGIALYAVGMIVFRRKDLPL